MVKRLLSVVIVMMTISSLANAALTDPTRPANYTEAQIQAVTQLNLSAIFTSSDSFVAVINGSLVKDGDVISGYQVVNIQPHAVVLKGAGGTIVQPLVTPRVKTPISTSKVSSS